MRVFVSEMVCGGGWPDPWMAPSLVREGRAMWQTLVRDVCARPDVSVLTTWDSRLGECPLRGHDQLEIVPVAGVDDEWRTFQRLAALADGAWVIAPETGGCLERRVQRALELSRRCFNCTPAGIASGADKFLLSKLWTESGVSTPETILFDIRDPGPVEFPFPCVLKPRDGAGSWGLAVVQQASELQAAAAVRARDVELSAAEWIVQPWIAGRACSVAVLVDPTQGSLFPLCPADQHLSPDAEFHYRGGRIPARSARLEELQQVAAAACRVVPGLAGYVGVDVVVPDNDQHPVQVIELNPRLTTSYLGYSRMYGPALAGWLMGQLEQVPHADFEDTLEFQADGTVTVLEGM